MRTLLIFIVSGVLLDIGSALDCPSDSDGCHKPYCECRYGLKYDSETNACSTNPECPPDVSNGTYPECTCVEKNFEYSKYLGICFRVCPENSSGRWPQCDCDIEGYVFDKSSFKCVTCPADSSGQHPDCSCSNDGDIYNNFTNSCQNTDNNELSCEGDSFGYYPNCKCTGDGSGVYDISRNDCVFCPDGTVGIYPHCVSETVNASCPLNSTGVYPDCKCQHENMLFIDYINQCIMTCPNDDLRIHPNCRCEPEHFYDVNDFTCKSIIGKMCPPDSIGDSPDCLCARRNATFNSMLWACEGWQNSVSGCRTVSLTVSVSLYKSLLG